MKIASLNVAHTLARRMMVGIIVLTMSVSGLTADAENSRATRLSGLQSAPNGAWCWFQDERVVIDSQHPEGPLMLLSAVSFSEADDTEHGDIDLLWYNLRTGERGAFELHDRFQADDHDCAALFIRPDGRYLAVYSKHSSDNFVRWRVTSNPHDPTAWQPEQACENAVRVCYSNVFLLQEADGKQRLYNFSRAQGFDPNYFVSEDFGSTFTYGGKLHTGPDGNGATGQRPYVKYAAHGDEALHFTTTDGHPRDEDNSVYHGYLRAGMLHQSDGTELGPLSAAPSSNYRSPDFTTVLAAGARFDGAPMSHAWTVDLHVDEEGRPYGIVTARANNDDADHRFLYIRWDGVRWFVREIAKAGGYLYRRENDYTGLAAVHPHNPNVVFISTPVDPRNDAHLSHYELFMGVASNPGDAWAWTPITWESSVDNLRPVIPIWSPERTALLWLSGTIDTYTDWDSQVLALFAESSQPDSFGVPGQPTVTRKAIAPDAEDPASRAD